MAQAESTAQFLVCPESHGTMQFESHAVYTAEDCMNTKRLLSISYGHFAIDILNSSIAMILTAVSSDFGISVSQIGFAAMIYTSAASLSQPFFGILADQTAWTLLRCCRSILDHVVFRSGAFHAQLSVAGYVSDHRRTRKRRLSSCRNGYRLGGRRPSSDYSHVHLLRARAVGAGARAVLVGHFAANHRSAGLAVDGVGHVAGCDIHGYLPA